MSDVENRLDALTRPQRLFLKRSYSASMQRPFFPLGPNATRVSNKMVALGFATEWGNPFPIVENSAADRRRVVELFRDWFTASPKRVAYAKLDLRGKDLACWCPLDQPCHADVLIEIANS